MVSTELLDRLHQLNRTDKLYVMQTLLNDLLAGEQASSIETVLPIEVKPDVIKL